MEGNKILHMLKRIARRRGAGDNRGASTKQAVASVDFIVRFVRSHPPIEHRGSATIVRVPKFMWLTFPRHSLRLDSQLAGFLRFIPIVIGVAAEFSGYLPCIAAGLLLRNDITIRGHYHTYRSNFMWKSVEYVVSFRFHTSKRTAIRRMSYIIIVEPLLIWRGGDLTHRAFCNGLALWLHVIC